MHSNLAKLIPVCQELEKNAPNNVNHALLLDLVDQILEDAKSILPNKRSGYSYDALFYSHLYCQMTRLSFDKGTADLRTLWKGRERSFQQFRKQHFRNGKHRRPIPDEPTLSRFLKRIKDSGLSEEYANLLLWSQVLYAQKEGLINQEITLIADYVDEPCKKNENDPNCFGTKKGKTCHRTLTFSLISNNLHLILGIFKISKRQHKLPLFETIISRLRQAGFNIIYILLDRGFYRKELLSAFKRWKLTIIMPGRSCLETRRKIQLWIQDKSGRTGKATLKLTYVKKSGWQRLSMDLVIVGKRGYTLDEVKKEFRSGKITKEEASKRVFPLLIVKGNSRGIQAIRGNENYIRSLYRKRWTIEIAFRQTHLIGISNWFHERGTRLIHFAMKCLVYNLWQMNKHIISQENQKEPALNLDEFCGKIFKNRTRLLPTLLEKIKT
jgi:hypothetical protein